MQYKKILHDLKSYKNIKPNGNGTSMDVVPVFKLAAVAATHRFEHTSIRCEWWIFFVALFIENVFSDDVICGAIGKMCVICWMLIEWTWPPRNELLLLKMNGINQFIFHNQLNLICDICICGRVWLTPWIVMFVLYFRMPNANDSGKLMLFFRVALCSF